MIKSELPCIDSINPNASAVDISIRFFYLNQKCSSLISLLLTIFIFIRAVFDWFIHNIISAEALEKRK